MRDVKDLKAIPNFQKCYIDYHQDVLIDPARLNGFGIEKNHKLSDLEILAKLQHFGSATGLLDFTRNKVIALWFACQKDKDDKDGKVFIINTSSPTHFVNITHNDIKEKTITEILLPKKIPPFVWEPIALGESKARIMRQHSLFVIETFPPIEAKAITSIKIAKGDKENILKEIKENFDIDESSIFRDFYGFTTINRSDSDIPLFHSFTNYFQLGNIACQKKEHKEAIRYYSKAIELEEDCLEAYYNRGNSYVIEKKYDKAIKDYNFVIDRIIKKEARIAWSFTLYMIYFNRANAYSCIKDYKKAIEDYDLSSQEFINFQKQITTDKNIRINPNITYNQGNNFYCLGEYSKAIKTYEKCIEIEKQHIGAWFNKGNSEALLFQFHKARESYTKVLKVDPNHKHAQSNFKIVELIIQTKDKEGQFYPFSGNKGNKGMFCGVSKLPNQFGLGATFDLYGANDGFEGYPGFVLIYSKGKWEIR